MGLLDGFIQKQNEETAEGGLIDLGLNSKIYYEGADSVQNNGVDSYGNYQFVSLEDVINTFIVAYVGEDKIINKIKRTDVAFHAQRSLAELSFDTLKSVKSYELEVPATLTLPVPQDYIHYVGLYCVDSNGVKKRIYPTSKTSNPIAFQQNTDGTLKFEDNVWKNPRTGLYEEYGITRSYDSFGNPIASETHNPANSSFTSKTPLPQFAKEIRVNVTGDSRALVSDPTLSTTSQLVYNSQTMQINFNDTLDVEVGMSVFGPGIPLNSTVATVGDSTSTNYAGTGITITNPEYIADQLLDSPTNTAGRPLNVQQGNTQVIIVDLNKLSDTWSRYKAQTSTTTKDNYEDNTELNNEGRRYGIDPQHAQNNGSYYINDNTGLIHFSSNISGKTIILDYLSDSLGTDSEMKIHKFAEEALYKCIAYAVVSTKANIQEYIVNRFRKERFAAVRKAKLRLSNLKLEELTQILRGKSKQIKH
tara:strand:- start:1305 stop:2729 length:1425 start_codon:yes stop_codon:yes gene_type:complete